MTRWLRLTKPVLEHVHGEGGGLLWPGFLIPPGISREIFSVVRRRGDIVPRFVGSTAGGPRGGVRDAKKVIERIDFILVEGLVGSVGGNLWRWDWEVDGDTGAGDNGGRSCLRNTSGWDSVPGAGNGAGGRRCLGGDGGGDDSDGRHFVDLKSWVGRRARVYPE